MLHTVPKLFFSKTLAPVCLTVVMLAHSTPSKADISTDSWLLNTRAELVLDEGFADQVVTEAAGGEEPPPVLPFNLTHTATADLQVIMNTGASTYDFSTAGDTGLFGFSFDHTASGVTGPFGSSLTGSDGFLTFTPNTDVAFSLSGDYTLTGTGLIHLSLSLIDQNNTEIFSSVQETSDVLDQSFVVGINNGMLEAGTQYTLAYNFHVEGLDLGNVSALGGINLSLGIETVPAPGAAALGLLGLGTIALIRRRFC